jgi:diacylglycerol kinase (ATP)
MTTSARTTSPTTIGSASTIPSSSARMPVKHESSPRRLSMCVLLSPAVPGIGVITNPRSRVNKRDPARMRQLGYLLGSRGAAEATRTLDDLYRAAEEFRAAGIDILGINGGDGTIHVTLSAFLQVYGEAPFPKVAILPGGTLNTIAAGLSIRGNPQEMLYEVIDRYHQGEELPTVECNILGVGERYGFIFGNGIVANFLEAYYATGRPSPIMGAKVLLRAIASTIFRTAFSRRLFRRFVGQVTVDGQAWARRDFVTVMGATVPEIGIGFKPFYRYDETPGHFPLLGLHCSPFGVVTDLPRIYRGRPMRRDKVISVTAREARLQSEEPFAYTIDGDLYTGATDLRLAIGPRLRLIRLLPVRAEAGSGV